MVDRIAAIRRVMSQREDVERGHIRGHRMRYRVTAPDARGRSHKFGLLTLIFNPYSDTIIAHRSVFRQPMATAMHALETDDGPTFFQSSDMVGMSGDTDAHFIAYSWAGGGKFCIQTRRTRDKLPAQGTLRAGHTLMFQDGVLKGDEFKVESIDRTNNLICLAGRIIRRDWNQIVWANPATFAGVETGLPQTGKVEYTTGKIARSGNVYTGPTDFTFHNGYNGRFPGHLVIDTKAKNKISVSIVESGITGWRLDPVRIINDGWLRILANDGKMIWQNPISDDINQPYQYNYKDVRTAIRAESKVTFQIVTGVTIPKATQFKGIEWVAPAAPDPPTDAKSLGVGVSLGRPLSQGDAEAQSLGIGLKPGQPAQDGRVTPSDMDIALRLGKPGQDGRAATEAIRAGLSLAKPDAMDARPQFFESQTSEQIYDDQIAEIVNEWLADMHTMAGSGFDHPPPQRAPAPVEKRPAPRLGF